MNTYEQIEQLQIEAGAAGDTTTVAICDRALAGDPEAVAEVLVALRDAAARRDEGGEDE